MTRRAFLQCLAGALLVSGGFGGAGYAFMHKKIFGALPGEELIKDFMRSSHYYNGEFHNLAEHPILSDESSTVMALLRSLFVKKENPAPVNPLPAKNNAFAGLAKDEDVLVWLGHSSFFMQLAGKRILIDPVFSPYASPVFFSVQAFAGATPYGTDDLPAIDYVFISHDHWDHLDYPTLMQLKPKLGKIVCALGVKSHLLHWGFAGEQIIDGDWGEHAVLADDLQVHFIPSQHFSGRTLTRNKTLWCGFVLETPQQKIFFSGDSGYEAHFAQIGKAFGGIDLALLDCGQYNERWKYVHMNPEEASQAAVDLHAGYLLPMHIGKFSLAYHAWYEPFDRITAASRDKPYTLLTPMIGERLALANLASASFPFWWKNVQ